MDTQWSTKQCSETWISHKYGSVLRCSKRVRSSCFTSGIRLVNLVSNPVIIHECGKEGIVITTNGIICDTYILCRCRINMLLYIILVLLYIYARDRRGRIRMVVGFTTTYAISAYHHWCFEFESRSERSVQHFVIKLVSDLRQVGGFLRVLRFPPPIKLTATI
jgi:hypothetical protein